MNLHPTRRILGVSFFTGTVDAAVETTVSQGGLVVAPSAPGLAVDLVKSTSYREALTTADLAITDSGFMVLLWRLYTGEKLPRHSGLKFLRAILERPELKEPGAVFWVMPSAEEDLRNRTWLVQQGFPVTVDDVYIAPHYSPGDITDDELVRRVSVRQPRVVMLAIGGGVQERVGLMLRDRLAEGRRDGGPEDGEPEGRTPDSRRAGLLEAGEPESRTAGESESRTPDSRTPEGRSAGLPNAGRRKAGKPESWRDGEPEGGGRMPESRTPDCRNSGTPVNRPAILCLGAAIAFLTGGQASIPPWADKLILGWLLRLLSNPRKFWRRYWDAVGLARLLWRYRERLPG
jgi:UDP-N-acetyl-D-mannosaminuronic acid transferase (WecB/TagA/CpsF family)